MRVNTKGARTPAISRFRNLALALLVLLPVAGCARGKNVNPLIPTPTSEIGSPAPTASPAEARRACQDGTMTIGDIPGIDAVWQGQLDAPDAEALQWHDDAQLVQLRVSCALFGSGFRLQPSYFSAQAQAILAADTRESQPVNLNPENVQALPLESISFQRIYEALIEADYTDDLALDPSTGIDIRINSEQAQFGPTTVPPGALVAHVSIEHAGVIKDLFINEETGEIYTYQSPG
jgi:hypothetical protein